MPHVKPDLENYAQIKVVGVGGSGSNAISRMMKCKIEGVELIAMNTDSQALHRVRASKKIHIGKKITEGLGAGMNPEIGRAAAEESAEQIKDLLKDSDMVFITCGMGGGTGTGASSVVAKIAKDLGALTIAVVTKPFSFEGAQRKEIAEQGITELENKVDALITISNDRLLNMVDRKDSLNSAFWLCDDILRQAVQGISDLVILPGIINVDFADVRTIMSNAGAAIIGVGKAKGEDRAQQAARAAINSPLLDLSIEGAKGVLFNVSGGKDMSLTEINEIAKIITEKTDPHAKIIFGAVEDSNLKKGEIKVTVVATVSSQKPALKVLEQEKMIIEERKKREELLARQTESPENEQAEWEIPAFLRKKNKK